MNVFSTIKKIFNSYDFRGNRIKNLRVDTPNESIEYRESKKNTPDADDNYFGPNIKNGEDGPGGNQNWVANKKYVDKKTTLNTDKTWEYKHPFFIWWLAEKDIAGKPYKEVFDELFFPDIDYQFISPEVTDVIIFVKNNPLINVIDYDNNFKKFVIYENCNNKFKIRIKQERNDWISSQVGKIIFELSDGTKKTYNSKNTSNEVLEFEINTLYWNSIDIKKITFERIFDKWATRYSTYGNISQPKGNSKIENVIEYKLEKDITDYFYKICYPFSLRQVIDNKNVYVDNISISKNTSETINLQVSTNIFPTYCLKAYIYKSSGEFINHIIMSHTDFIQKDDGNILYNFGCFPYDVKIQIVPESLKIN